MWGLGLGFRLGSRAWVQVYGMQRGFRFHSFLSVFKVGILNNHYGDI